MIRSRLLTSAAILLVLYQGVASSFAPQCPPEWKPRAGSNMCYAFYYELQYTWSDARAYCRAQGGDLLTVESVEEKEFVGEIAAQAKYNSYSYWIGLSQKSNNLWYWVDGHQYSSATDHIIWSPGEPNNWDGDEHCTELYNQDSKMNDRNCANEVQFICKRSVDTPMMCPTGYTPVSGYCLQIGDWEENYDQARYDCQNYYNGGDLITLTQKSFVQYLDDVMMSKNVEKVYVGLREQSDGTWTWVGNVTGITANWAANEPPAYVVNQTNLCAVVYKSDRLWHTQPCDQYAYFVCSQPEGGCYNTWEEHDSKCYQFNNDDASNLKWRDAYNICKKQNSSMLHIYSSAENYWIWLGVYDNYWLGITDNEDVDSGNDGKFIWSDTQETVWRLGEYENFFLNKTVNIPKWPDCAYMDPGYAGYGYWHTVGCNDTEYFICEANVGQKIDLVNDQFDNSYVCPKGWHKFGTNCYYVSNFESEWENAKTYCNSNSSSLAMVLTDEAQSFLNSLVQTNFFIGLNDRANENSWVWEDVKNPSGVPLPTNGYKDWGGGQPDNYQDGQNCVRTVVNNAGGGQWNGFWDDIECSASYTFVCSQDAAPASSTTPPPGTTTPWPPECGPYWVYEPISGYCYRASEEENTWLDALDVCHAWGGDLASIHNLQEETVITAYIRETLHSDGLVWIGANDRSVEGGWTWTDGSAFNYLNWNPGEPNNAGGDENCAEIYLGGAWNDDNCQKRRNYLCEKPGPGAYTSTPQFTTPQTNEPGQYFGCPTNWQSFSHNCYIWVNTDQSWTDAKTTCRKMGGDLASVHSHDENSFVLSLIGYENVWLGLNDVTYEGLFVWSDGSKTDFTTWDSGEPNNSGNLEDCVELYQDGVWNDNSCSRAKPFVCKQQKSLQNPTSFPPTDSGCDTGFVAYDYSCYIFEDSSSSLMTTAKTHCESLGGHLVYINDRFEQGFLTGELAGRSGEYWIGANEVGTSDTFHWIDGSTIDYTNWDQNYPDSSKGSCVRLTTGKEAGFWQNDECYNDHPYICEVPRRGFSPPASTLSTKPPNNNCPDTSWHKLGNTCYKRYYYGGHSTYLKTWEDARDFCRHQNGDLASIHTYTINTFLYQHVTGYTYYSYWIGLNSLTGAEQWSDGTAFDYFNWGSGEPNDQHGNEDCVEFLPTSGGKWNDNSCAVHRNWICQIAVGQTLMTTTAAPAPTNSPYCNYSPAWHYFDQSCYKIGAWYYYYSWRSALAYCKSVHSNSYLVSIHSNAEENFIIDQIQKTASYAPGYWSGLNQLGYYDNQWRYPDGSPEDFSYWQSGEPNDGGAGGAESCVEVYTSNGQWNDLACGKYLPYICKYMLHPYAPPTPPPPATGNCPAGWTMLTKENKCFRIFGSNSLEPHLTWSAARDKCRKAASNTTFPDLISINHPETQLTLLSLLKFYPFQMWIGLSDQDSEGDFQWSDESDLQFTNWNQGEPNGYYNENCVEMYPWQAMAGKWNDLNCGSTRGYVCEQQPSTVNPTPTPSTLCKPGYIHWGTDCYKKTTTKTDWLSAEKECTGAGEYTYLASIEDLFEEAFLRSQFDEGDTSFWIGMNDQDNDHIYTWSDGWPVLFSNWAQNEPSAMSGEGCVIYTAGGYWDDVLCNKTYLGICKYSKDPKPTLPPNSYCDSALACPITQRQVHWVDPGSCYCYYYEDKTHVTQPAAENQCVQLDSHLVSIHTQVENDWIKNNILSRMATSPWIGLVQSEYTGGFKWTDTSALDYIYWNSGEPNDYNGVEQCGQIYRASGKWNDLKCADMEGYICKVHKTPKPTTTWHGDGECFGDPNWIRFNETEFCYYISHTSAEWLSWRQSKAKCVSMGGDLVSIHGLDEETFLLKAITDYGWSWVNTYWIGLSELEGGNGFKWSDTSQFDYYDWNKGEPNNAYGDESCVELYHFNGKWNDDHCAVSQPFICKRDMTTGTPPATPSPTPIVGNCPAGFFTYPETSKCYSFHDDKKTWAQARSICLQLGPRNKRADLVSIHNSLELDFLIAMMPFFQDSLHFWVGLTDRRYDRDFLWTDETDFDFTNWNPGEPNGDGYEDCVEMYNEGYMAGKWNDVSCSSARGYICEVNKDPQLPVQPTPTFTTNMTCPSNYEVPYTPTQSCYRLTTKFASWQDSLADCQTDGGYLASITSAFEEAIVRVMVDWHGIDDAAWIGMHRVSNEFEWSDHWPIYFTDWGNDQPSNAANEDCVKFHGQDGTWDDTFCNQQYYGVCKYTHQSPPVVPTAFTGICPNSTSPKYQWMDAGGATCYQIVPDAAFEQSEANLECQKQGTTLASIHDSYDMAFLQNVINVQIQAKSNYWIGLIRGSNANYMWTDKTPVDYTNWSPGEPNYYNNQEDCTEVYRNGKWNDIICTKNQGYICGTPKIPVTTVSTLYPPVETTTNPFIRPTQPNEPTIAPNKPPSEFPALGVAGAFLIAILGIIIIASIYLIWSYRRSAQTVPFKPAEKPISMSNFESPVGGATPSIATTQPSLMNRVKGLFIKPPSSSDQASFENAAYLARSGSMRLDAPTNETNGVNPAGLTEFSQEESV